jgi:hypothetical protein
MPGEAAGRPLPDGERSGHRPGAAQAGRREDAGRDHRFEAPDASSRRRSRRGDPGCRRGGDRLAAAGSSARARAARATDQLDGCRERSDVLAGRRAGGVPVGRREVGQHGHLHQAGGFVGSSSPHDGARAGLGSELVARRAADRLRALHAPGRGQAPRGLPPGRRRSHAHRSTRRPGAALVVSRWPVAGNRSHTGGSERPLGRRARDSGRTRGRWRSPSGDVARHADLPLLPGLLTRRSTLGLHLLSQPLRV